MYSTYYVLSKMKMAETRDLTKKISYLTFWWPSISTTAHSSHSRRSISFLLEISVFVLHISFVELVIIHSTWTSWVALLWLLILILSFDHRLAICRLLLHFHFIHRHFNYTFTIFLGNEDK